MSALYFGRTKNGPTAMMRQLVSLLEQLRSASLTASCSVAAFSPSPGRLDEPTATALQPDDDGSARLRLRSSLASTAMAALPTAWKKPMTLNVAGTGTTKTSSAATIRQGTVAAAPHSSRFRRADSS